MNDREESTTGGAGRDGRRARRSRLTVALVFVAGTLTGVAGSVATVVAAHGSGGWHGGRHHGMHGAATLEEATERVQLRAAWALGKIDATEAQRESVDAILQGLVKDAFPLREEHRANRRALIAALVGPEVDDAAIERIRASEMVLADEFSRALAVAIAEVSKVLDPEQRRAIGEFIERRHR